MELLLAREDVPDFKLGLRHRDVHVDGALLAESPAPSHGLVELLIREGRADEGDAGAVLEI